TGKELVVAWVPWVLLTLFVFAWGLREFKAEVESLVIKVEIPNLHKQVARHEPVAVSSEPEAAIFRFDWLTATGTGIMIAALCSAVWKRISPATVVRIFF